MKHTDIYLNSEFKPYVKLDPVGDLTMDDYDFTVEFYCFPNRKLKITKSELIRKEEAGEVVYVACVNSKDIGTGELKCDVTRHIPDADFPDGMRTERITFNYNVSILK